MLNSHHPDCDHLEQGDGVVPDCNCGAGKCRGPSSKLGTFCGRMESNPIHNLKRRGAHPYVPGEIDPAYAEEHEEGDEEEEEDFDYQQLEILRTENVVLKGQNATLLQVIKILVDRK